MDPTHNPSPDEPALPNVPSQPTAETDTLGMPPAEQSQPAAPEGDASVPMTPPPAASWLPPTVPVQASNGQGTDTMSAMQTAGTDVQAPAIADDGDVIEKEWVDKAKQIVARNQQDPYNQTLELHKFKAEYLRKRYNKTIEAAQE